METQTDRGKERAPGAFLGAWGPLAGSHCLIEDVTEVQRHVVPCLSPTDSSSLGCAVQTSQAPPPNRPSRGQGVFMGHHWHSEMDVGS